MKLAYICENCNTVHPLYSFVFPCEICEKEICHECMKGWAVCKSCGEGKTDKELEERYNKNHEIYN